MAKKKINELDMTKWKEYDDIITDSLWLIDKRDKTGNHKGDYHGNFIPQIPNQLIKRYTRKGDWILDAFLGSGTTLIECQKLGRNGIGIDIDPEILSVAKERATTEAGNSKLEFLNGDSSTIDLTETLKKNNIKTGINKIVSGKETLSATGRYGKGAVKKGLSYMREGIRNRNIARGTSSVVGSTSAGILTSIKTWVKTLFR